jgi:preprotein translocase SecF subunit
MLIACVAMLIYVTLRFRDFKMGFSSIVALFHDAVIVIGFYALLRIPLNSSFIAAVLTILGYSINASIIIFDRIRENKRKFSRMDIGEVVDKSVTQTFRRTIFTSLTTFFTVVSLYVFGVASVKEFALPIAIGVVCGAYSSTFVSGSVYYILSNIKKAN